MGISENKGQAVSRIWETITRQQWVVTRRIL